MKDGLYIVETRGITAGFVVERGRVVRCAPVLRRGLKFWRGCARWLEP